MINFDYKKRLDLNELNEKIDNVNKFENNQFNLGNIINKNIKN